MDSRVSKGLTGSFTKPYHQELAQLLVAHAIHYAKVRSSQYRDLPTSRFTVLEKTGLIREDFFAYYRYERPLEMTRVKDYQGDAEFIDFYFKHYPKATVSGASHGHPVFYLAVNYEQALKNILPDIKNNTYPMLSPERKSEEKLPESKSEKINPEEYYQQGKNFLQQAYQCIPWNSEAYTRAVDCFEKALAQGFSWRDFSKECMAELMRYFPPYWIKERVGTYSPKDYFLEKRIALLLLEAAYNGCAVAQYEAGQLTSERCDLSGPKKFHEKSKIFILRAWIQGGTLSEEECFPMAFNWYKKSALQGYAKAQYQMGNAYRFGEGVEKDGMKAIDWYRKAAENKDCSAQAKLAYFYANGCSEIGIIKNEITAAKWYKKAAAHGFSNNSACTSFDYLIGRYIEGRGVPKNRMKAIKMFSQYAEECGTRKDLVYFENVFLSKFPKKFKFPLSYEDAYTFFMLGLFAMH